ncbi:MAG: twin-arginine translocation signal domain-containing protein [Kiritimatiellae bacterium]|nr:twin-arginine translocation signal domain-containing protein [Kiritimatiellia bacterium]
METMAIRQGEFGERTVSRRDFIKGSASMVAVATTMGGVARASKISAGGAMSGYIAPRLENVRVGVVGVGDRGSYAVRRLCTVPGVEVTALCDLVEERALKSQQWLKDKGFKMPRVFTGPEGYKRLCESGLCDVVHNNTDWSGHVPVSVYAMKCGLHACVEVPGCRTVDEGWEMVETSESTRRHCIMLENCCYGDDEMLVMNLARRGKLGVLIHGEGGYIHDGRWIVYGTGPNDIPWRLNEKRHRTGMPYPTHGLGPIALAMNINRGDRFDYLVSTGSASRGYQEFARQKYGEGSFLAKLPLECNDMNVTTIRTVKGRTIMLQQYGAGPHPYSRMNKLVGTGGVVGTYPLRVAFEKQLGAEAKDWYSAKELEEFRREWQHPLWKAAGDIARASGGHGGMDYLMDLRWVYCLQQGLPVDMDVYDLASWSAIVQLSEESTRNRSKSIDIPDFTRGAWATTPPVGDMTIDVDKIKLDLNAVRKSGRQQSV